MMMSVPLTDCDDECTTDSCEPEWDVVCDDACTYDECVSPTGCSYTTVDCDDYDACKITILLVIAKLDVLIQLLFVMIIIPVQIIAVVLN